MGDVMHSIYHLMMETAVVGRVQNMDGQRTEANPQQKTTRQNNKHAQAMEQTVVGDGFNGAGLQGCMFWVVGRGGILRAHGRGKLPWSHWPARPAAVPRVWGHPS